MIRQVLVDLIKDDLIFFNCNCEKLLERGSFYTRFASEIESDPVGDYTRARMVMEELDIDPDEVTTEDYSSLRYIAEIVSRRASFMASAGITALLYATAPWVVSLCGVVGILGSFALTTRTA